MYIDICDVTSAQALFNFMNLTVLHLLLSSMSVSVNALVVVLSEYILSSFAKSALEPTVNFYINS